MYAFILLAQLTLPALPEPLSLEPTLAAQCQCRPGEACRCGDDCTCHHIVESNKMVSVVKQSLTTRKPRIDSTSPITLAPDPDYDDAIAAFKERWSDPTRKIYVGKTLPPEPAAVGAKAKTPTITQPSAAKQPAPIDRAAMTYTCVNGVCQWVPVTAAPTKSVRTYQRRGLLGRWRR